MNNIHLNHLVWHLAHSGHLIVVSYGYFMHQQLTTETCCLWLSGGMKEKVHTSPGRAARQNIEFPVQIEFRRTTNSFLALLRISPSPWKFQCQEPWQGIISIFHRLILISLVPLQLTHASPTRSPTWKLGSGLTCGMRPEVLEWSLKVLLSRLWLARRSTYFLCVSYELQNVLSFSTFLVLLVLFNIV